jgi:1A family penicillin-binding protein
MQPLNKRPGRILLILAALTLATLSLFLWRPALFIPMASASAVRARALAPSSDILDRNGQRLYEIIDPHAGVHRPASLDEIPLALRQAIVATEDASFYVNVGVEPRAILRAAWLNLREGRILSGGSTITQQLARNLMMEPEERYAQTWSRKAREALLAFALTRELSKDEILELYLNETYFGSFAYGVEAAAHAYLRKPVSELNLAECALLAGLPQSPPTYNPLTNLAAAKTRQRTVLDLMVKQGYITPEQAELAFRETLKFAGLATNLEAPHFVMLVREQLTSLLGEETIRQGGLRVYTTLDLGLQHAAEAHLRRHLERLNQDSASQPSHNVNNGAVIAMRPDDGAVLALVGSPDYTNARISGAVNAALSLRQPGSAIKPITYAAAFTRGYSPASAMADVRTVFLTEEGLPYMPVNYDLRYHGLVSLRQALGSSYNVIAVKLLDAIGIDALVDLAGAMGVTTLSQMERQGLALGLGGGEVQLWQLTSAYAALANGGWRVQPYIIERIEDRQGNVLYAHTPPSRERVLDERVAYLITDVLADSVARSAAFGQNSALETPFGAAVKTGTTTEWRDNWTIGYTIDLTVGVWVGNADNTPMVRISGVTGAAPIWNEVMRSAHRAPPRPFERPAGLLEIEVCAESGLLPGPACTHRKKELFLAESAPQQTCSMHRLLALDALSGELAQPDTPEQRTVYRAVTLWPAELRDWAAQEGLPLLSERIYQTIMYEEDEKRGQAEEPRLASSAGDDEGLVLVSPYPASIYRVTDEVPRSSQQIEIAALARARLGRPEVHLWINGQLWHTWDGPPYRIMWRLEQGVYTLEVSGVDARLQVTQSAPIQIVVH